ncbi:MVP-like protein [Mya arenaria]|uniref:Major vault protein n=1 Tax=Mya arenaria TaxID=6604 RepID=A0ABY7FEU7_MYAAR|nr:MVP-like protein [Mya arenaria]
MDSIIAISPLEYIHVVNLNTNITRLERGPQALVLDSNERLACGPLPMIVVPPAHYCEILNPTAKYVHGEACELKIGQIAVRFHGEPFCLYPGEELVGAEEYGRGSTVYKSAIKPQPVVRAGQAIRVEAVYDHTDEDDEERLACEQWQIPGPCLFYPTPNMKMVDIIDPIIIKTGMAVKVRAQQGFTDDEGRERVTGEEWYLNTPGAHLPHVYEEVVSFEERQTLTENTGLILRATQTLIDANGEVVSSQSRLVLGQGQYCVVLDPVDNKGKPQLARRQLRVGCASFFLNPGERLEKGIQQSDVLSETEAIVLQAEEEFKDIKQIPLSKNEGIYVQDTQSGKGRDKTRVVQYRCPGNTAVQVNNYLDKTARVVFGPDLVILGPHDNFTYTKSDLESESKVFAVPDFIGFACRQIASKIRAAVALIPFDEFHRHSAQVIQHAVFQDSVTGETLQQLKFAANNLVITSIDIQSIEPVDKKMSESLSKSVQLAIEIATSSLEAAAQHEAKRIEQIAKGELERQKLESEKQFEAERCKLLELRAVTAAVESTGQATAEAQAQAERLLIECESEIEAARLKARAQEIEHYAQLETQDMARSSEISFVRSQTHLELEKERANADIEVKKFADMVSAIGAKTLAAIATAGPDMQVRMLTSLGMESTLITDGNTPINLFLTAQGLVKNVQNSSQ